MIQMALKACVKTSDMQRGEATFMLFFLPTYHVEPVSVPVVDEDERTTGHHTIAGSNTSTHLTLSEGNVGSSIGLIMGRKPGKRQKLTTSDIIPGM